MTYRISLVPSAARQLKRLERPTQRRIRDAIDALADDPRPQRCSKLSGLDAYRIRVGDYRVIYQIRDDRLVVLVVRIAHRADAYRKGK